ncbi:MAG: transposase InsO family protein [Halioglobus sp.]|jgi:transposase InsO family protein
MEFVALGLTLTRALEIADLTRHQYYYIPKKRRRRRGPKPTTTTPCIVDGELKKCANKEVIEKIKTNHSDPDLSYGYKRMTTELQITGYQINHKKVYRIMKEEDLLQEKQKVHPKKYVKYRILIPDGPLKALEMDIKFIWIESNQCHGYILTIIDVFTRMTLEWHIGMSITQHTVKQLWASVIEHHLQEHDMLNQGIQIEIRNDNDPRFSAKLVQDFFAKNYLKRVFTHPFTPQENGHIESFHAILGRSLNRRHFETLDQVESHLVVFYEKYNNTRLHGSIANLPPRIFWDQWLKGNISRIVKEKKKVKFKLKIPYHELSGNGIPEGVSCSNHDALDGQNDLLKEVVGADSLQQPSVQR